MIEWECYASWFNDLTDDELITAFDGELNPNSTRSILGLMLGGPRYMLINQDTEILWYKTRNGNKCFKITKDNVVSEVECPKNVKWIKSK